MLVLDKPAGITSHDLVARTRKALQTRKVGHAGTLDPMATGVMLLGVGDATRLLTYFVGYDKTYSATIRLGLSTTTEDAEGEVTRIASPDRVVAIDEAEILEAMSHFVGDIEQVPSAVSAIKVDGKRSYQRVRDGEEVELKARPVHIERFELLEPGIATMEQVVDGAPVLVHDIDVEVECSSGTYIRALARDLGNALKVGAHLTRLRRSRVGAFTLEQAADPDGDLSQVLMSLEEVASAAFPVWHASEDEVPAFQNGRRVSAPEEFQTERGPVAVFSPEGLLIGLVEVRGGLSRTLMNLPQREATEALGGSGAE